MRAPPNLRASIPRARAEPARGEALEVRWGRLSLKTAAVALRENSRARNVIVEIGPNRIGATHRVDNHRVLVTLEDRVTLNTGDTLEIRVEI